MSHRVFVRFILLTISLLSVQAVFGQETDEPNPIKWTIKVQPSDGFAKYNLFALELRANIDRGWHLYSTEKVEGGPSPTRISLLTVQSFEIAGEIASPAPRSAYDPNFQVATEFYEGDVAFTIPIKLIAATVPEKIRLQVRYQTCTPSICLPPKLLELEARLLGEETSAVANTPDKPAIKKPDTTGPTVTDFEFTDFNGKARRLSEFRGKVVLLDFWASWCSPCLADIPQLKLAYQKYGAQGFEILGMDSETLGQKDVDAQFANEAQAKAREIVSTRGITWTQSTSESSLPISALFSIDNLPAKLLLDKQGKVVARIKSLAELDELLPRLLRDAQ